MYIHIYIFVCKEMPIKLCGLYRITKEALGFGVGLR